MGNTDQLVAELHYRTTYDRNRLPTNNPYHAPIATTAMYLRGDVNYPNPNRKASI
ncbi:hypothetical protein [Trinickia acidisoli]|uniref:hypothetical protein n=1 Tax=Trinickia acidisoli TaxID=2767482 RepID=UPI001A8CFB82|nr:hypothetical protein [Trinickia acidisoli]